MADVSVRPAGPGDAEAIGEVQVAAWQTAYAEIIPAEVLAQVTVPLAAERWREGIVRPPNLKHRVLVALEGKDIVGFAALAPAKDEPDGDPVSDAELAALLVHPDATRRGHGSRLMAAAVDTMRDVRYRRVLTWVFTADIPFRTFLTSTGWAPDGAQRDLDLAGTVVRQERLHAAL